MIEFTSRELELLIYAAQFQADMGYDTDDEAAPEYDDLVEKLQDAVLDAILKEANGNERND